ncbi:MAG: hypothetical protein D6761_10725 [Candidatus Dadabacteria bacterium]|nr:MAG: hypothetical protein D6761_10725 [Candidatus Dadabacteria bacterium]
MALTLVSGCGIVDTVKSKIEEALANLTALSEGNLEQLVSTTSSSAKTASEQLSALSGKTDTASLSSRFGNLTSGKGRMSLLPQQDSSGSCVTIDRTVEDDGTRKATSTYSGCDDGRSGIVTATMEQTLGDNGEVAQITLGVEFDSYTEQDGTDSRVKNGSVDWTISFLTGFAGVVIQSNEQTTLNVLRVNEATGVPFPVTVQNNSTISYNITPADGTLKIDGSGSFTQNDETATLSFAGVIFDFAGDDACETTPREGSVVMKNAQNESITVTINGCDDVVQTNPDGTEEKLDATRTNAIFENTLRALADFHERLGEFRNKKLKSSECSADLADDKFETEFHGKNSTDKDNNAPGRAATIVLNEQPDTGGFGISLAGNVLKDEDWYAATLSAGTYVIEALPKSADDVWPFVCAFKLDSAGKPVPLSGDTTSTDPFDFCFPGGTDFTIDSGQRVLFRVFDPFEEYSCQSYTLSVYDPDSGFAPPDFPAGGGDCDPSWIGDGVCDDVCVPIWVEQGLTTVDQGDGGDCAQGVADCPVLYIGDGICDDACLKVWNPSDTNPETGAKAATDGTNVDDGGDCSSGATGGVPGGGSAFDCPMDYIGDGVCDAGCIYVWGPNATNPLDATKQNGLTDAGDCLATNPDIGCSAGDGFCIIDYQCGPPATVAMTCGELSGSGGGTGGACPAGTSLCLVDAASSTYDCIPSGVSCPN